MPTFARLPLAAAALFAAPPARAAAPSFERDVLPVLTQHCLSCHGGYRQKAGLDLRTRAGVLKGGESGAAVVPGSADTSLLLKKVAADEMPQGMTKLTAAEKKVLRDWVAAGAPAADSQDGPLGLPDKPRPAAEVAADIDREVDARLAAGVKPAPVADDAEFLRRAYLDLAGTVPTADAARAFLDSKDASKRAKLIDELLAGPAHAKHAATGWHNLLVPFADGKRVYNEPLRTWLADGFGKGRGWDKTVRDLLTAEGDTKAVPAVALFAGTPEPNEAAEAVGRLFLGVQLECAECHNSPQTPWRQKEDFWALAAFFGQVKVAGKGKIAVTEGGGNDLVKGVTGPGIRVHDAAARLVGEVVPARVPGAPTDLALPKPPYRPALADWVVRPDNPYFANAAANRWWAHLLGRGLVHPVDDFRDGNPPSHPRLLGVLRHEFVAAGFDHRHLVRSVCNSQAYQRTSAVPAGAAEDPELFARMPVRMLTPEQLHAAFGATVGVRGELKGFLPVTGRGKAAGGQADFVNFFGAAEGGFDAARYNQGVLQVLQMLNGKGLNTLDPMTPVGRVVSGKAGGDAVETLYLTVLSRRPTAAERARVAEYAKTRPDAKAAHADLAWALLNSSEFTVNH